MIREYDPSNGAFIGAGFAAPADARGLAFDGASLYVSTTGGQLLTLNPNTGAVLNSVSVSGGVLIELGANAVGAAAIPEPSSVTLFVLAALGFGGAALRRRKRVA